MAQENRAKGNFSSEHSVPHHSLSHLRSLHRGLVAQGDAGTHADLFGSSGTGALSRKELHNCTNCLPNICLSPTTAGPDESSCITED